MVIRHHKYKEIFVVCIVLVNIVITNSYNGPDLRGSYCANRKSTPCCRGRQDECSVRILETLCYCDEFCNRTRDDCCPDYASFCIGIPETTETCEPYQGITYPVGHTYNDNCNECKCQAINNVLNYTCGIHRCLTDEVLLDEVNRNYRLLGWRASKYPEFWGKKYEEGLLSRLGTLHSRKRVLHMQPIRHPVNIRELPRYFDARVQWPGRISLPKDQEWCGASWAFSTAAVISDRFDIMKNRTDHVVLSPQHLLSCNSRNQRGCQGGHLTRAWNFIRQYGLVSDNCYPWEGSATECRIPRYKNSLDANCPSSNFFTKNILHRVGPAYKLSTPEDIMYEIIHSGPVQAVIKVSRDFFSYKSGIYRCSGILNSVNSDRTAYHSVRIIGWGEERLNNEMVKYWIVSNSWGTWWGENGFFRIRKGTNECTIETFVIAAWIKNNELDAVYNTAKISHIDNSINP